MSSNICFRLKLSARGWVSSAFFAASPMIIPGLVSLTKPRPVHYTSWGYGLFAVMAALIALRHFRTATVLEAGGIRLRYTFSGRYLPWSEITGVEIGGRGKVRLVHARISSGQLVRLPAPMAGGGFDGTEFDAQVAEITAAWNRANSGGRGAGTPRSSATPRAA